MIEGGSSRSYLNTKKLMYSSPAWDELMGKLVKVVSEYALEQVRAGADVIQIFDSWAGCLSVEDYREYVLPRTTELVKKLKTSGVPIIYFATDSATLLPSMKQTGAEVIGLDWRIPLDAGWETLNYGGAVQGNLDPALLFADWKLLKSRAKDVLDLAGGRPGHIFNLGHGILPETPVEAVKALTRFVQEQPTNPNGFSMNSGQQSPGPQKTAVLLLAHGSPDTVDDVPEFLLRVTRGRTLPKEVIEEVKHRYALIGHSPLTDLTIREGELLSIALALPVYVGMRNWKPLIAGTLQQMLEDNIKHAIAICLAPQNSRTSVGLYRSSLGIERLPFSVDFVESWHDHPLLIKAFAEKLRAGLGEARAEAGGQVPVIFTAHSVPQITITQGDPYAAQAKKTASLVAEEASVAATAWRFAFQSQGMSGGPWIGPTVEETILEFKAQGYSGVFLQPIGFLCDHVEVLFDIDIAFKTFAEREGMRLWRAESLNDSPLLISALADIARSRMASRTNIKSAVIC